MEQNSPKVLLEKYHSKKLNKDSLIQQLIELIEISNIADLRLESITILDLLQVQNHSFFKTLEHLLISDSNWKIREAAANYLKGNYFTACYEPIKWAFFHDDSPQIQTTLFITLKEIIQDKVKIHSPAARNFLVNEITLIESKEFKIGFEDLCEKHSLPEVSIEELGEILINYFIYVYLQKIYWRLKIKINKCKITELDFIFKGLMKLPEILKHLTHLEKLVLRYNQLVELPEWLGSLQTLTELNLNVNSLISLPKSIGSLHDLELLSLWKNELEMLPNSIGKLKSLKYLNLRLNHIKELPYTISQLSLLVELNLHDNRLKRLPESIGKLGALKKLNLSWNEINELPDSIGNMKFLEVLDLERNELSVIPDSISSLRSLEFLNLRDNKIEQLPENLKNIRSLKILNLTRNRLHVVPEILSELSNLEELYLGENFINELPKSLKNEEKRGLKIYW